MILRAGWRRIRYINRPIQRDTEMVRGLIVLLFNDSVIMAPTVNCRIESGRFTINSPDKAQILKIFNT